MCHQSLVGEKFALDRPSQMRSSSPAKSTANVILPRLLTLVRRGGDASSQFQRQMHNECRDLLREHWRHRRNRILGELRGLEAGSNVLPETPEGEEVRAMIRGRATALRADLEKLEGYLGAAETTRT